MSALQPHVLGAGSFSTSLSRSVMYWERGGAFPASHTDTLRSLRCTIPPPLEHGVTFLFPVGRVPQPPATPAGAPPSPAGTRIHTDLARSRGPAPGAPRRIPRRSRPRSRRCRRRFRRRPRRFRPHHRAGPAGRAERLRERHKGRRSRRPTPPPRCGGAGGPGAAGTARAEGTLATAQGKGRKAGCARGRLGVRSERLGGPGPACGEGLGVPGQPGRWASGWGSLAGRDSWGSCWVRTGQGSEGRLGAAQPDPGSQPCVLGSGRRYRCPCTLVCPVTEDLPAACLGNSRKEPALRCPASRLASQAAPQNPLGLWDALHLKCFLLFQTERSSGPAPRQ